MQQLKQRIAIITGASRGIGRAMALAYAREGAQLTLVATDIGRLEELKAEIIAIHGGADSVVCMAADVRQPDQCEAVTRATLARFGRLDVLINNAGVYRANSFLNYTDRDFQDMLDVNLFGVIHFVRACLPVMQQQKSGAIINVASTAGKWGSRNQSAYNVSKHAVVGLTRCLALEASGFGVTVNAICPGFVQTDMVEELKSQASQAAGASAESFMAAALARVPLGRVIQPEEVAEMAVYLGSAAASGVTGQSLHIDGGMVLS